MSGTSGILTDLYRLQGLGGKTINFKADDKGLRDIADNLQRVAETDLPLANFLGRKIL